MKKSLMRIVAVGVTAVMLVGLAGCGAREGDAPAATPTPAPAAVGTNEEEDEVENGVEVLPYAGFREHLMDLGGRHIVMIDHNSQWYNLHAIADMTPNETIEVIDILRQIGLDYNATIEVQQGPSGNNVGPHLQALRAAGDTPYDIYGIGMSDAQLQGSYMGNIFMDMNHPSISHIIDLENNPWDVESGFSKMVGRQFGVHFKIRNSGQLLRSTVVFNSTLAERFQLPNLYEMVFDRTWNWDAFQSVADMVVLASDGTVQPMIYLRESAIAPALIAANNGLVTRNTPGGFVFVAHQDENTLEALNWWARMIEIGHIERVANQPVRMMADGQAMFIAGDLENLRALTRQDPFPSEYMFGLLPIPMGPQRDDYVSASFTSHMYHIFNDIYRPDQVAAILVAMANRLTRIDIVEHELNFGVQDMESSEVLAMLLDRIVIDDSRAVGSARATIRGAMERIENLTNTPVQALQSIAEQVQGQYDAVRPVE
jgi:hypothetical protein